MLPEFFSNFKKIGFTIQRSLIRKTRVLPGSEISVYTRKNSNIEFRQFTKPLFSVRHVLLQLVRRISFTIREKEKGIRLEAVLVGEMVDHTDAENIQTVRSGEYRLSDNKEFILLFQKKSACSYFITRYSDELLDQIGIKDIVKPSEPRFLTPKMTELIQNILSSPYEDNLRDFHYDNCIRELLFLHFTDTKLKMPSQLTEEDYAIIISADNLLQQDLKVHNAIPELADKVSTNEFKLKKGFKTVFGMGIFERLTFHRMEMAKSLLKTTRRTIDDIADDVGYSSRSNFINAFRKIHKTTPKKWRMRINADSK